MASSDTFLLDFEAYRPPAELKLQKSYDQQVDEACQVSTRRPGACFSARRIPTPRASQTSASSPQLTSVLGRLPARPPAQIFGQDQLDFMARILQRSAISPDAFFPPAAFERPLELNIEKAKQEAELVMFGAVEGLLAKTGIRPDQIDIVITATSCFNAVPSLASMLVNKFKFRDDVDAYHLGGMGCSSGVTAPGMAAKLLKSMPKGGYALV
jgi:predicted naringenin-chalcone synthase